MRVVPMSVAAVALIATASVSVGCSGKETGGVSAPSSNITASSQGTMAAGASPDYTALLIKDTDVSLPGAPTYTAAPPTLNPSDKPGVGTIFTSTDGADVIADTILILPDAQTATNALLTATPTLGQTVTGGTPASVAVGAGGVMQSGTSPDGTKSVTVLLFTQGPASVTLEFDGPPQDPVLADYATMVGRRQDDAIKNGLHGR